MTREEYLTKLTVNCCQVCNIHSAGTIAELNKAGWMWYSSEAGEYAICPDCERVRAEQAAVEREKEKEHNPKGFSYGT